MARIAGVDLPGASTLLYALPYLFGIGRTTAKQICVKAKIPENKRGRGADATPRSGPSAKSWMRTTRSKAICVARFSSTSSG